MRFITEKNIQVNLMEVNIKFSKLIPDMNL